MQVPMSDTLLESPKVDGVDTTNWLEQANFDVIVVGTGLTESLVAGALARNGKTVLHLDKNDFYGNYFSSFNLQGFHSLMQKEKQQRSFNNNNDNIPIDIFNCEPCDLRAVPIAPNIPISPNPNEIPPEESQMEIQQTNIQKKEDTTVKQAPKTLLDVSRQFNLDISPKILFSRGPEVELFISSGVAKYLEFKTVENTYLFLENDLQLVPCSKGDVFKSKFISLL